MTQPALLPPDGIARLRDALTDAGFTAAGIAARIGPEATAAVARNDFRAALGATSAGTPLDTLIRLYICGASANQHEVTAALNGITVDDALTAGLVEGDTDGRLRAGLDLEPYGDWWIVADLPAGSRPGPVRADHVLGVGGASTTLADAVVRDPVDTALDLGTGCGVQALHLSTHARRVTATDLSPRALRFAATTAALAGLEWDLREGDLAAPLNQDERFDLVVSNPPFVAGPGVTTHTYRDSGRPGDALGAEIARLAPALLNPGGKIQYLANWLHVAGADWAERVAGWFAGRGLDVWVIERELADPIAYVDLWLTDAAEEHDPHRAAAWLDWFDAHKVEGIGFGVVTARRSENLDPTVRVETLRQTPERPFGGQVSEWFARQDWLAAHPDAESLLAARFRMAPGLTLHQEAAPGSDGWEVTRQSLVQTAGLRFAEEVDPLLLALVGGCDGRSRLVDQVAVLAAAHDAPESLMAQAIAVLIPHLVEHGYLRPADAFPADAGPTDAAPAGETA